MLSGTRTRGECTRVRAREYERRVLDLLPRIEGRL